MKKPSTSTPREFGASQTIEEVSVAATERAKKEHRSVHKLPGGDGDADPPTGPQRLHLDKRAETIIAATPEGSDDELLTTLQVANWLGTSLQWVELGRAKGYGPRFTRIAPQVVRYKRSAVIAWLKEREYQRTSDYVADTGRSKRKPAERDKAPSAAR